MLLGRCVFALAVLNFARLCDCAGVIKGDLDNTARVKEAGCFGKECRPKPEWRYPRPTNGEITCFGKESCRSRIYVLIICYPWLKALVHGDEFLLIGY